MAKKPNTPPATPPGVAQRTFVLKRPLRNGDDLIREIAIAEPEYRLTVAAARAHPDSAGKQTAHMLGQLTGLPEAVFHRLVIADMKAIESWFNELDLEAMAADAKDALVKAAIGDEEEYERTFRLVAPVPTDKAPLEEITVRAPDLGAQIAMERFKTEPERVAALVAELADITIPLVMRMRRRDIARIEAWLAPFAEAGASRTASPGATSPSE